MVARPADLDAAKTRQMRRQKLGIEQAETAEAEPRDEVNECYLARVGLAAEHAFAEEDRAERETVQPAHHLAVAPALDRVRGTPGEERRV
jgi:hypothetical protein